jgi:formylglycine-generating enzyme required for sulfatase activity
MQMRQSHATRRLDGMVWIPGSELDIAGDGDGAEESRRVVDGFWIDRFPVTVDEFAAFVAETGYVTLAERHADPELCPLPAPLHFPGSFVLRLTGAPAGLPASWAYIPGLSWRSPHGVFSEAAPHGRRPVTHVACADALAFAGWAGKSLPGEAEWELAADHSTCAMSDGLWEWTSDQDLPAMVCAAIPPRIAPGSASRFGAADIPRLIVRGGDACARMALAADTSTGHIGFRCIVRPR